MVVQSIVPNWFICIKGSCPCDVMVNVLDCDIIVSKFNHQLRYYTHFRTNTLRKGTTLIYLSSYGLNSTTTVHSTRLSRSLIRHETKQPNQTICKTFHRYCYYSLFWQSLVYITLSLNQLPFKGHLVLFRRLHQSFSVLYHLFYNSIEHFLCKLFIYLFVVLIKETTSLH